MTKMYNNSAEISSQNLKSAEELASDLRDRLIGLEQLPLAEQLVDIFKTVYRQGRGDVSPVFSMEIFGKIYSFLNVLENKSFDNFDQKIQLLVKIFTQLIDENAMIPRSSSQRSQKDITPSNKVEPSFTRSPEKPVLKSASLIRTKTRNQLVKAASEISKEGLMNLMKLNEDKARLENMISTIQNSIMPEVNTPVLHYSYAPEDLKKYIDDNNQIPGDDGYLFDAYCANASLYRRFNNLKKLKCV